MKQFVALKDAPFGIKKHDIVTFGKVTTPGTSKGVSFSETKLMRADGSIIDGFLDPEKEKSFFQKLEEIKGGYKIGDKIVLKKVQSAVQVSLTAPYNDLGSSRRYGNGEIPAWTEVEVIGFRRVGQKIQVVFAFNHAAYRVEEVHTVLAQTYYFINSSGVIHPAQLGRDAKADLWRQGTNNKFSTRQEAKSYLDKVVNDTIGYVNWNQA